MATHKERRGGYRTGAKGTNGAAEGWYPIAAPGQKGYFAQTAQVRASAGGALGELAADGPVWPVYPLGTVPGAEGTQPLYKASDADHAISRRAHQAVADAVASSLLAVFTPQAAGEPVAQPVQGRRGRRA